MTTETLFSSQRWRLREDKLYRERKFPGPKPLSENAMKALFHPSSFFFPWYINPPFRDSWLEEVWVGFMFAINLYGEESRAM